MTKNISMNGGQDKVVQLIEDQLEAPEFTEDALALEFTRQHGEDLRFVAAWGKWLQWDGRRWDFDLTIHAFDRARKICREAAARANKGQKTLAKANTVAGVEKLAKADRVHAAEVEQWDHDPWIFNTGGNLDR